MQVTVTIAPGFGSAAVAVLATSKRTTTVTSAIRMTASIPVPWSLIRRATHAILPEMRVSSGMYLVFIAVPLIELALLLQVGAWIGPVPTIALVIVTAIAGASLARWQGLSAIERAKSMAQAGQLPAGPVFDGILILVAALLLLTPGILTDAVGFFLLVPLTRRWLVVLIRKRIEVAEGPGETREPKQPPPSDPGGGKIIDQDGNIVG